MASVKEPMIGRRLYALVIDVIIIFILTFFLGGLVMQPIVDNTTTRNEVSTSYVEHSKQYEALQDEYNVYIYDDNNNRIYNENITESEKNAFLIDSRVIELKENLITEQEYLLSCFIYQWGVSVLVASMIAFIIIPLILQKGRTIGKLIAKLYIIDQYQNYASWYLILLRGILSIITNILLGILTLGIVPLLCLLMAIFNQENYAPYDYILKTNVVDGKLPIEVKYASKN